MREMKFRGIDLKTGKMVYGGGIDTDRDTPVIISQGSRYFVDVKTIGQYTGLKDKSGVEIYEGDIVNLHGAIYEIKHCEAGHSGVMAFHPIDKAGDHENHYYGEFYNESSEVIGNIHESPELLGE